MVLFVPIVLGACSPAGPSTREAASTESASAVQSPAPHEGTERRSASPSDDPPSALRASCAELLNELPIDAELELDTHEGEVLVEAHAEARSGCANFSWIVARTSRGALIEPLWGGPERDLAWDCQHSSLDYGVYRVVDGVGEYLGGGLAYGKLERGVCRYSVDHFPPQPGADSVLVAPPQPDDAAHVKLQIGVRAWSHNDPDYGHGGDDCDSLNCYWSAGIRWTAQ